MSEKTNDILSIIAWTVMGTIGIGMIVVFATGDCRGEATEKAINFCGCDNKTCIVTYTERRNFNEDTWRKLCWEEKK